MNPSLIWLVFALLLFVGEMLAPGVVLLFFGLGGLLTALLTFIFDLSLTSQILIFGLSSIASLFYLRNKFKDTFIGSLRKAKDKDAFLGKIVEVKKVITAGKKGKVILNGTDWNAISEDELKVGEQVMIIERKNLTLKVAKKDF